MQALSFHPYPLPNAPLCEVTTLGKSPGSNLKPVTDATFARDVIEQSRKQPVLVLFYASWCPPCKVFTKRAEQLAKTQNNAQFVKVLVSDYDAQGKIKPVYNQRFKQYGGVTYPSIMLFANGKPEPVFRYYKRDENNAPIRHVPIPGQIIGSPSSLSNQQISSLIDTAASKTGKGSS